MKIKLWEGAVIRSDTDTRVVAMTNFGGDSQGLALDHLMQCAANELDRRDAAVPRALLRGHVRFLGWFDEDTKPDYTEAWDIPTSTPQEAPPDASVPPSPPVHEYTVRAGSTSPGDVVVTGTADQRRDFGIRAPFTSPGLDIETMVHTVIGMTARRTADGGRRAERRSPHAAHGRLTPEQPPHGDRHADHTTHRPPRCPDGPRADHRVSAIGC